MRFKQNMASLITLGLFAAWGIAYLFLKESLFGVQLFIFVLLPFLLVIFLVTSTLAIAIHLKDREVKNSPSEMQRHEVPMEVAKNHPETRNNPAHIAGCIALIGLGIAFLAYFGPRALTWYEGLLNQILEWSKSIA